MLYIFALLVLIFLVIVNYNICKDFAYPPFLYSVLWFFLILIHFLTFTFNIIEIFPLSLTSLMVFVFGALLFTFGGLVATFQNRNIKDLETSENNDSYLFKNNINKIILIIALVLLPINAYESYLLAQKYIIFDSLFAGLRNAAVQGDEIGFSKYGILFGYVSLFVEVYRYAQGSKNKLALYLSVVVILLYCILSTGRTFFLIFLCLILGIMIMKKLLKVKYVVGIGISIFLVFIVVGYFLGKGADVNTGFSDNLGTLAESFLVYLIGGLSAFDLFINGEYQLIYGEQSLRFIMLPLQKIGLIGEINDTLVQDYVQVPFMINVYTIYRTYFLDFGLGYLILVLFLVSFLHTNFFYKARISHSFVFTFLYSILLYPLIMSFFQEQYMTLLPTWTYLLIIIYVVSFSIERIEE